MIKSEQEEQRMAVGGKGRDVQMSIEFRHRQRLEECVSAKVCGPGQDAIAKVAWDNKRMLDTSRSMGME